MTLRKPLHLVLVVALMLAVVGLSGCGSVAGTYVDQNYAGNFLELNKDGTCLNVFMGFAQKGTWETKGDQLRVYLGGLVLTATIKGNKLITPEGQVLVKK